MQVPINRLKSITKASGSYGSLSINPIYKVVLPGGGILAFQGSEWYISQGVVKGNELQVATEITDNYQYGPQDGYPGVLLVQRVARELKGRAVIPRLPQGQHNTVY
jgi:hypothetical protein